MIVMKFGGTSVEDARAIERSAGIVKGRLEQKPAVVVSAMARVTDLLLAMARAAGAGDRKTALKLCRALQERHPSSSPATAGYFIWRTTPKSSQSWSRPASSCSLHRSLCR